MRRWTAVTPLVEDVAARGYPAVREATLRFDGVDVPEPRVPAAALAEALDALDPAVRAALAESIRRARIVHEAQRRETVEVQVVPGGTVTERWIPVQRVGLYVPGGLAVYPSSVVMNVVPAQVAGVASIAVFTPAQKEFGGLPHPTILAACALLGVDEVYAVGGAQAIALRGLRRRRRSASSRSTSSPARATSTSRRPSGWCAASSASTPRPARPRSPCWPTPPPIRCTSRPT